VSLTERLRAGGPDAHGLLYDEHAPRLYAYCDAMLGDEATDAVRDTLIAAVRGTPPDTDETLPAWLFTLARAECVRQGALTRKAPVAAPGDTLGRALARLRTEHREVLALSPSLDGAGIASVIGVATDTAESLVRMARRRLDQAATSILAGPSVHDDAVSAALAEETLHTLAYRDTGPPARLREQVLASCAIAEHTPGALMFDQDGMPIPLGAEAGMETRPIPRIALPEPAETAPEPAAEEPAASPALEIAAVSALEEAAPSALEPAASPEPETGSALELAVSPELETTAGLTIAEATEQAAAEPVARAVARPQRRMAFDGGLRSAKDPAIETTFGSDDAGLDSEPEGPGAETAELGFVLPERTTPPSRSARHAGTGHAGPRRTGSERPRSHRAPKGAARSRAQRQTTQARRHEGLVEMLGLAACVAVAAGVVAAWPAPHTNGTANVDGTSLLLHRGSAVSRLLNPPVTAPQDAPQSGASPSATPTGTASPSTSGGPKAGGSAAAGTPAHPTPTPNPSGSPSTTPTATPTPTDSGSPSPTSTDPTPDPSDS
jgi:DNA-directed RNA polymerase specialized sigma24 family protein